MSLHVFNGCMLIGWLLVLIGGVLLSPGAGLMVSGLLLLVLVFLMARLAGGLYVPERQADQPPTETD